MDSAIRPITKHKLCVSVKGSFDREDASILKIGELLGVTGLVLKANARWVGVGPLCTGCLTGILEHGVSTL